jgi:hypothetical protein
VPDQSELTDKNGRPLRGAALANKLSAAGRAPRPVGAAEADAMRGKQIEQLAAQNRALLARISTLESVLGPAFARTRTARQVADQWPARLPDPPVQSSLFSDDPRHDARYVTAATRNGDVRSALREIAEDTSVSVLMAQRASIALDLLAAGSVKTRGARDQEKIELITSIPDALDAATGMTSRGQPAMTGRPPAAAFGVVMGADGVPRQQSVVHHGTPALGEKS